MTSWSDWSDTCGKGTYPNYDTDKCEVDIQDVVTKLEDEKLLTFVTDPDLGYTFTYHNFDQYKDCSGIDSSKMIYNNDSSGNCVSWSEASNYNLTNIPNAFHCSDCSQKCDPFSGNKNTTCKKCKFANPGYVDQKSIVCENLTNCTGCRTAYHPVYKDISMIVCDSCLNTENCNKIY
jgi:hypothetical protein